MSNIGMPKIQAKNYHTLFDLINGHTLVITANNRLERVLNKAYLESKQNEHVLLGCPIYSFQSLIDHLWHKLTISDIPAPQVLSGAQAKALWLQAISEGSEIKFQSGKSANLAETALNQMQEWCLNQSDLDAEENSNTQAFIKWLTDFDQAKQDFITERERLNILIKHLPILLEKDINRVIHVGFDSLTPQFKQFCDRLSSLNISVDTCSQEMSLPQVKAYAVNSNEDELYYIGAQIKQYVQDNPGHQISVVCHNLQQRHAAITRIFDEVLIEDRVSDNALKPYTISGGASLYDMPIINDLFAILTMTFVKDYEVISQVLLSPYIAEAETFQSERAQLDIKCRQQNYQEVNLKNVLYSLSKLENAKEAVICLEEMSNIYTGGQYTWYEFIKLVQKIWTTMAWPGLTSLSSDDYQAVEQFYVLLDSLHSLGAVNAQTTFSQGVQQLQKLSQETLFQPESNHAAQIDVLGVLESSEIIYDHIWWIGVDELSWPAIGNSSPLIPINVLKAHEMPHYSVEHEHQLAKKITDRIYAQSPQLTLSYAMWADETEQNLSPLFREVEVESITEPFYLKRNPKSQHTVQQDDVVLKEDVISRILDQDLQSIKGGSQLLQSMSRCPFRTALKHRLKIEPFPEYLEPLNAMQKGIFIHEVLEKVWRNIQSSACLTELTEPQQTKLVIQSVHAVMQDFKQAPEFNYLFVFEEERLIKVINEWLNYEKQRVEPFDVVACEQAIRINLEGVELKLRVDRIDQLSSGGLIIIDYKTSKSLSIQSWINTRVSEPQLPLYAIFYDADAIAYAQVNHTKFSFTSISNIPGWVTEKIPKSLSDNTQVKNFDNWGSLLDFWKLNFSQSLIDYKKGKIDLIPGVHCQFCEFSDICRKETY
ncbi:PD-(D/E)XK nuclease family protein [Francisellaceae bacterium]|nr:PD-(D/E)XK nuclease family protein [Francisellaceae bacterium]